MELAKRFPRKIVSKTNSTLAKLGVVGYLVQGDGLHGCHVDEDVADQIVFGAGDGHALDLKVWRPEAAFEEHDALALGLQRSGDGHFERVGPFGSRIASDRFVISQKTEKLHKESFRKPTWPYQIAVKTAIKSGRAMGFRSN